MCATCGCKAKKSAKKAPAKKSAAKKLSPKQKKLDTDKNGKLEGSDFAALRAKKGKK
jgi:hypothetical protein